MPLSCRACESASMDSIDNEPLSAAILSSHRRIAPYGAAGDEPGATGHNRIERASGEVIPLKGCDRAEMQAEDVFVIETPGCVGYGAA